VASLRGLARVVAIAIVFSVTLAALPLAQVSAAAEGALVAIDARSGDVVWRTQPPAGQLYSLGFATSGGVFVAEVDGELCNSSMVVRVNAEDGDVAWKVQGGPAGGAGAGVVLVVDNYDPGQTQSIRALDEKSGAQRWRRQVDKSELGSSAGSTMVFVNRGSGSTPAASGDLVLSRLEALHRRSSTPAWVFESQDGVDHPYGSLFPVHSDARYTLLYDEDYGGVPEDPMYPVVRVLDTATGSERFTFELRNQVGPILVKGRWGITQDGTTLAVRDLETGEIRWQRPVSDRARLVDASVRNGSVYVANWVEDEVGPLVAFELRDGGKRWASRDQVTSASVTRSGDLITFTQDAMAGVDPKSGRTRWTRGYPAGVAPTWGSPDVATGDRTVYLTSQCDY
jgi:outer membrane protein assembly factor BamB